jgi:hypothetical protein
MTTFEIQGPTRTCSATGQTLEAGAKFYGVLVEEAGRFVRKDFAESAWQGAPENAVAFWKGRIPTGNKPRKPTFNDELLFDCFDHLAQATEPSRLSFRYVVALLLMRRKRLKFEDTQRDKDGADWLIVKDTRSGSRLHVRDPRLSEDEIASAQEEVFHVLGWE